MVTIRKQGIVRDVTGMDATGTPCTPVTRVAAWAVIPNPFAGRFVEDLTELFEVGANLGELLAGEAVGHLGGTATSYGKAAIVGVNGDMEHGGAVIHPRLGKPMREVSVGVMR